MAPIHTSGQATFASGSHLNIMDKEQADPGERYHEADHLEGRQIGSEILPSGREDRGNQHRDQQQETERKHI
jgi:hypothetical protein